MWRDTRLIVLVAQTAALYAAVLIPFKVGIPLIPGFAELRPANALPIVASLLFGPAAAWGAGLGNVIGDCFGTLSAASAFGFLGNFLYGYVPYLLWGRLGPLSSRRPPEPRSWRQAVEFTVVCAVASLVCAAMIGWGADLLGLVPFEILTVAIFFNNLVMALLLAPPLLLFLSPRVTRWGLTYEQIVRPQGAGVSGQGSADPSALPPRTPNRLPASFIDVEHVTFTYPGSARPALRELSLRVSRGQSVAVMGRTGSGKSTLCYTLNGLVPQTIHGAWTGRILVDGTDTTAEPVWRQSNRVGVLFQDFETQLISTNLLLEMAFPLEHAQTAPLAPEAMRQRIRDTLARVGLPGLESRDPLTLSGGQRQRLVLGTILARRPDVLVLDEPFTDLDPDGRRQLTTLLEGLRASGATLVITEHDPDEALRADLLCVLLDGSLAWSGPPRDLFGRASGQALARELGIQPLPLAACFEGLHDAELPLTVEEAWAFCDRHGLTLAPPDPVAAGGAPPSPPREAPPVIEARSVSYGYGEGPPAVEAVSLSIRDGEFVALIGQNGSGKSTLAGLFKGLRHPTEGRVLVDGVDVRELTAGQLAARVGYVFQNPDHQIFAETVEAEVAFGARNLGCPPELCAERVTAALDAVGLESRAVRRADPFSLTKGDRQRIAVASVLAQQPHILIFDEPSTGLDGIEISFMMEMIRRLNERGHTIVMITHAMSLVAAYARRCLVLRAGRLELDGSTRDVFARLQDGAAAARLGLEVPALTRFAGRWGRTLLTVDEVTRALRRTGAGS